ncbi:MAG: YggS family pyridoxal phosphate-dependent enzyme [Pseudomonadota bacterium]
MSLSSSDIQNNLASIRERIRVAATEAGRDVNGIRLVAVTKYMPPGYIQAAMSAGQHCFGENTLQDARSKQKLLDDPLNEWHFIGHLQSNKAKAIPGKFAWLHTLDSLKLARKLSESAIHAEKTLNVLLQVNIANDPDKFGLPGKSVYPFIEELLHAGLTGIRLRGLMAIGRRHASRDETRANFTALRNLGEACAQRFDASRFSELSMGMSKDFEIAIAEGATLIRVGSSIFGQRPTAATSRSETP